METTERFEDALTFRPALGTFAGLEARPHIYKHSGVDLGIVFDYGYKIGVQVVKISIHPQIWLPAQTLPVELASTYDTAEDAVTAILNYFETVTLKPLYLKRP